MKVYKVQKTSTTCYRVLLVKKYFFGLIEIYHCLEWFDTLHQAEHFITSLRAGEHKDLIP